jgi:hypothetical protein
MVGFLFGKALQQLCSRAFLCVGEIRIFRFRCLNCDSLLKLLFHCLAPFLYAKVNIRFVNLFQDKTLRIKIKNEASGFDFLASKTDRQERK